MLLDDKVERAAEAVKRGPAQSRLVSRTIFAIARDSSSPKASRPAATPARSVALRFWLVFHFAPDVDDLDLDPDDRPALHGDEVGWSVADRPRLFAPLLEGLRQFLDLPGEPDVVHHFRPAFHLDHRVIPGRHDFAGLRLVSYHEGVM